MRDFRPVVPPEFAPDPFATAASVLNGGPRAARAPARTDQFAAPRSTPASSPAPAAGSAPVGWIDRAGLTAVSPLHRSTVTGAGAGRPGNHVGGAMLPPPAPNTVALSDGTRISFRAVEESLVLEYA